MAYFTYRSSDGLVDLIYRTAAEANTRAQAQTTAGTTTTAHTVDTIIPEFIGPGIGYYRASDFFLDSVVSDLDQLKTAMWRAHEYLIATWEALHAESASHPWAEVTLVHDYYARIHPSNYRIVKENPNTLTHVNLIRYCTNLLDGPIKDGSSPAVKATIPELFVDIVTALTITAGLGVQGITYVKPNEGTIISPQDSLILSNRKSAGLGNDVDTSGYQFMVTDIQLASGNWINELT